MRDTAQDNLEEISNNASSKTLVDALIKTPFQKLKYIPIKFELQSKDQKTREKKMIMRKFWHELFVKKNDLAY